MNTTAELNLGTERFSKLARAKKRVAFLHRESRMFVKVSPICSPEAFNSDTLIFFRETVVSFVPRSWQSCSRGLRRCRFGRDCRAIINRVPRARFLRSVTSVAPYDTLPSANRRSDKRNKGEINNKETRYPKQLARRGAVWREGYYGRVPDKTKLTLCPNRCTVARLPLGITIFPFSR